MLAYLSSHAARLEVNPSVLLKDVTSFLGGPDGATDISFLRLLSDYLRITSEPKEQVAVVAALLLKRLQLNMSKFPLDDVANIFETCNSKEGVRNAFGPQEFNDFLDQLSEYLLKLKSIKAVSDNEVKLYSTFIRNYAYYQQGSPLFWEMLETKLERAVKKVKQPDVALFNSRDALNLMTAFRRRNIKNPYLWKELLECAALQISKQKESLVYQLKVAD